MPRDLRHFSGGDPLRGEQWGLIPCGGSLARLRRSVFRALPRVRVFGGMGRALPIACAPSPTGRRFGAHLSPAKRPVYAVAANAPSRVQASGAFGWSARRTRRKQDGIGCVVDTRSGRSVTLERTLPNCIAFRALSVRPGLLGAAIQAGRGSEVKSVEPEVFLV